MTLQRPQITPDGFAPRVSIRQPGMYSAQSGLARTNSFLDFALLGLKL